MLSQSSISSKARAGNWASRFLGSARREPAGGAGRDRNDFDDAKTPQPAANAPAK